MQHNIFKYLISRQYSSKLKALSERRIEEDITSELEEEEKKKLVPTHCENREFKLGDDDTEPSGHIAS